jgi:hypothetical protein
MPYLDVHRLHVLRGRSESECEVDRFRSVPRNTAHCALPDLSTARASPQKPGVNNTNLVPAKTAGHRGQPNAARQPLRRLGRRVCPPQTYKFPFSPNVAEH